jgi:cytochrome P450 family 109
MRGVEVPQPGSKGWLLDASPWYKAMRAETPVFHDPRSGTWHVFLYSDVEKVLMQFNSFSSQFGFEGREDSSPSITGSGSMITSDPPLHTKLRKIVAGSFSPTSIRALEPRIDEIASQFLSNTDASVKQGKAVDFISEFSDPLPVTVIAEMLGIPIEDRKKFKEWSDVQIGSEEMDYESRRSSSMGLAKYLSKIIEERKTNPKQDLISSIVNSEIDGEKLTLQEAVSFCILLLVAGNETTTNLLGSAIRLFAKYTDSMKQLRDKPATISTAVEEVLRFASPVRGMFRVSVRDSEISGQKIPSGQSLIAWIGSANRDETKFVEADKFEIGRTPNPHIAFGHGIHLCLGAPLARLESKVALQLLTERYSEVKLKVAEEKLAPLQKLCRQWSEALARRICSKLGGSMFSQYHNQ